jgi:hypothetical protein
MKNNNRTIDQSVSGSITKEAGLNPIHANRASRKLPDPHRNSVQPRTPLPREKFRGCPIGPGLLVLLLPLVSRLFSLASEPHTRYLAISRFFSADPEEDPSDHLEHRTSRPTAVTAEVAGRRPMELDQMPLPRSCTCLPVPTMVGPNSSLRHALRDSRLCRRHRRHRLSRICCMTNTSLSQTTMIILRRASIPRCRTALRCHSLVDHTPNKVCRAIVRACRVMMELEHMVMDMIDSRTVDLPQTRGCTGGIGGIQSADHLNRDSADHHAVPIPDHLRQWNDTLALPHRRTAVIA